MKYRKNYGMREGRSQIGEIIEEIRKLQDLQDLKAEDFAPEGGYADKVAQSCREMKTAQLRKFFDTMRKVERDLKRKKWEEVEGEFLMLEPRLAAAVARGLVPSEFYELMKVCIEKLRGAGDEGKIRKGFERLTQFLEAIVAYHKYYGGD